MTVLFSTVKIHHVHTWLQVWVLYKLLSLLANTLESSKKYSEDSRKDSKEIFHVRYTVIIFTCSRHDCNAWEVPFQLLQIVRRSLTKRGETLPFDFDAKGDVLRIRVLRGTVVVVVQNNFHCLLVWCDTNSDDRRRTDGPLVTNSRINKDPLSTPYKKRDPPEREPSVPQGAGQRQGAKTGVSANRWNVRVNTDLRKASRLGETMRISKRIISTTLAGTRTICLLTRIFSPGLIRPYAKLPLWGLGLESWSTLIFLDFGLFLQSAIGYQGHQKRNISHQNRTLYIMTWGLMPPTCSISLGHTTSPFMKSMYAVSSSFKTPLPHKKAKRGL